MALFEESCLQILFYFAISYLINSYVFKYFIIKPFFVLGGPGDDDTAFGSSDPNETISITRAELKKLIDDQVQKAIVNTASSSSGGLNIVHPPPPLLNGDAAGNVNNPTNSMHASNIGGGFLSHVSFKAPQPLYSQNPSVWFAILEHQFTIANVTQETTKFSHAVSNLDARLHNTFANLIIRDKGATPYSTFKEEIIKNLGESEKTKLHNLLHGLTLGDQKPSQLLLKFKTDAGDKFSADSLRQLWMSRLPPQVQIVLTAFENDVPISVLAERADDIMETMSQVNANYNNQVIASSSFNKPHLEVDKESTNIDSKLTTMKSEILAEISSLLGESRSARGRNNNRRGASRERSSSSNRNANSHSKSEECYYHKRFNTKAQKCVSSCKHHQEFLLTQSKSKNE